MGRRGRKKDDEDRSFRYSVRHNVGDFTGIEWTRAATKHRISRARSRFVVERAARYLEQEAPRGHPQADTRLMFFGDDAGGIPLEVACVQSGEGRLIVIHAMLLRARHRSSYEEARRWQRGSDIQ